MTIRQRSARIAPTPAPPAQQRPKAPAKQGAQKSSFADHLKSAEKQQQADVTLSAHAQQRLAQRGISMNPAERRALADAVQQLDDKGAQDAAVMRKDAAFVVNVPSRTVVTALDQSEMQQRVFTQIDSAMVL